MDREVLDTRKTKRGPQVLVGCLWCGKPRWMDNYAYKIDSYLCCSPSCNSYYRWSLNEDLKNYIYRKGKDGGIEVEVCCEYCGDVFWGRYVDVKRGEDRFCNNSCAQRYYRQNKEDYIEPGFEKGKFYWSDVRQCWSYAYRDETTLTRKCMSGNKALWLLSGRTIPDGWIVMSNDLTKLDINNLRVVPHNWYRSGDGYINYPKAFSKELKMFIKTRDGNACSICSSTIKLHVHHLDGNVNNNYVDNLVSVCEQCHLQIHKNPNTTDPTILAFQAQLT